MNSITLDTFKNFFTFQNVMIIILGIVVVYLLIKIYQLDNNKKREDFYADSVSVEAINNLGKISGNIMIDDNLRIPATLTTMSNLNVNQLASLVNANIQYLNVTGSLSSDGDIVTGGNLSVTNGLYVYDNTNLYGTLSINGNTEIFGNLKLNGSTLVPSGTIRLVQLNQFDNTGMNGWISTRGGYAALDSNGNAMWSETPQDGYKKIPKIYDYWDDNDEKIGYMVKL